MVVVYNLLILVYGLIIRIFSLFNHKAALFVNGRKNWHEKLKDKITPESRYIWFHCASLGEFEQGRPVMEEIKLRFPEYKILLTFFSPSGYEIRKNYPGAETICYLPMDTPANARKFLNIIRPEKAFFVKYEFWYNFLHELNKRKIPVFVFSANFRQNQHFFSSWPWSKWFRKMLNGFDRIFVQSSASADLLKSFGINRVTVSGDTRFDRVAKIAESAKEMKVVEKFKDNHRIIVAGSTWKPDEELIIRFINQSEGIKYIIAPHEVSETNINRIVQLLKKPSIRFSRMNNENALAHDVLVIDSVGLLSSLYKYGEIAYIGGGFGVGIHNILEAATFGLPVVFGPNHEKFREAVELKSLEGAFCIGNFNNLESTFRKLLETTDIREKASLAAVNYVKNNLGATNLIIKKSFGI